MTGRFPRGSLRATPRRRSVFARRRGQAMVEFALVLPIMVMIFLAIIEFGFLLRGFLALNYMVSQAVKEASLLRGDNQGEFNVAKALLRNRQGLDPSKLHLIDPAGNQVASMFLEGDTLVDENGAPVAAPGSGVFFFEDNGTPADTTDDTAVLGSVTTADYVKISATYDHSMFIGSFFLGNLSLRNETYTLSQTKTARLE